VHGLAQSSQVLRRRRQIRDGSHGMRRRAGTGTFDLRARKGGPPHVPCRRVSRAARQYE
jgi:hypothetical protein